MTLTILNVLKEHKKELSAITKSCTMINTETIDLFRPKLVLRSTADASYSSNICLSDVTPNHCVTRSFEDT